ncbi:hypothetical protein MAR_011589 [Mya arenaria]|uniref:EF-hand domain-containing protein n=1 Tax=Mya arenaria TaxID=6604 RepID=A0ABY7FUI3_MYAAR|nr:uncharacterized protein LOC128217049 isoform X2 [Mya arenaria]XP_052779843.1 uncharacterized protein LOC128217049 isoform X2 [Mya arenaria]XP_052779844.1 uncharacterized protein LOC128217049 isoform X2 [Mya arenaria]WAR25885.1 hypothetical protein MAR_011589 [Mya arenaria]
MDPTACRALAKRYTNDVQDKLKKYDVLRDLDVFVLDNSIRESTVGQLRGHTLEDKWAIYNVTKNCGFKNTIVASFNQMTRVDDVFIKDLIAKGEDPEGLWAFSEITESIKKKVPDTEKLPVGLRKMQSAGLRNVIFEIDLGDSTYDFEKFTVDQMCALVEKLIRWCFENLSKKAKILINLRDPPEAMPGDADRVFRVVSFLSNLPKEIQLFGLIFEEPRGKSLPEECGTWAKYIREVMDDAEWKGHLLVHVHEKFGYLDATALEVLMNGADGIWASVCNEGAAMGNASSCVTLINLVRLGNKKILKRYNCAFLRQAAIAVTEISTGMPPHKNQPVYGARALDFVYDLSKEEFDLASFFGEKAPIRITTLASPEMIRSRLVNMFGEDKFFTVDQAYKMKEVMLADLRSGRKEEYMSKVGLAILFDRSGGKVTAAMRDAIESDTLLTPHAQNLLTEIRKRWDEWDLKEDEKDRGDNMLQFDSFYNAFMAPYFSCYRCNDTRKGLQCLDMDSDGQVDWSEFLVYLKWALHQYPDVRDSSELIDVAFRKGLIPAMRDELLQQQETK